MKIGIIGAGRIGQVHARAVANNPATELAMICDINAEAASAVTKKFGGQVAADADQVINSPEVDAVIICSPTPFHVKQIVDCVKAGKPVLCEKPLAMDSADVESLYSQIDGFEAKVMLGFNRRFDPSFAAAKDMADNGELGTVEQVTIISRDPAAPPKEYIAVSGGIFKDMTIHDFDMARFQLGDIAAVSAIGQNLDPELADTGDFDGVIITLTTKDGKSATITNSRHCATGYDQRLEVFGTKGSVFCDNVRPHTAMLSGQSFSDAKAPYLDFFLERYEKAYANELQAFVEAIEGAGKFSPSIADGAAALALAEAAEKSAKEGRVVHL